VRPDGQACEVASPAKVHDVLARAAEASRSLTGREEVSVRIHVERLAPSTRNTTGMASQGTIVSERVLAGAVASLPSSS
jgi:hypothetical protein